MNTKRYIKAIDRINAYITEITNRCGSDEIYLDKSSTLIGTPESITPLEITQQDEHSMVIACNLFTWQLEEEWDEDYEEWCENWVGEELLDDLKWIRKCVNNGLKFYQAEDPDRFLEQPDDEE